MIDDINFRWGPKHTPKIIQWLIFITAGVTLFSALTDTLFVNVFGTIGPQKLLSLSWYGWRHDFLWQPLTYLFIQEASLFGIHLFSLLTLAFNLYILWVIGTMVHERTGDVKFLLLYLGSGIVAGIITLFAMPISGQYISLEGPSAALMAVFVVWTMYYPNNPLFFLFLFPLKPKVLLNWILGIMAVIYFINRDFNSFIFFLTAILFGYAFGVFALGLKSPYAFTHPLDKKILSWRNKILGKDDRDSKIVKMTPFEEEAFMDEMLSKISKYGEDSLTPYERQRMDAIAERMKDEG